MFAPVDFPGPTGLSGPHMPMPLPAYCARPPVAIGCLRARGANAKAGNNCGELRTKQCPQPFEQWLPGTGCAFQRAEIAQDARTQMAGMSKEQVLSCMGAPGNKAAEGATEV